MSNIEEQLLNQRAKINWIRLGDGNNVYFHDSLKSKYKLTQINSLVNAEGTLLTTQQEIEEEILQFYGKLVGTANHRLNGINIIPVSHALAFLQTKEGIPLSL